MINKQKANKSAEKQKPIRIQEKNPIRMQQKNPIRIHQDRVTHGARWHWLLAAPASYPLRHPFPSPNAKHLGSVEVPNR